MTDKQERNGQFLFDLLELNANLLKEAGIEDKKAFQMALESCQTLAESYAGLQFYFPKGKKLLSIINQSKVFQECNGRNIDELAIKYGYSAVHIYRMLNKEHKLRQGDMFDKNQPSLLDL
jgi:Mor family transcriptional regulator